ncbi:MAG: hypothetical protein E7474_12510 [Ruminococcaceae bacterium]|nr:hypothetical protein [Oscillospiraceae bacterium]
MIEAIDYAVQFEALVFCGVFSAFRAVKTRDRGWLMLTFFYACYAMADLYWLLCVLLLGETPKISFISEMSWDVGGFFLCVLFRRLVDGLPKEIARTAWLAPLFSALAFLFFLRWSDLLNNTVSLLLMGWMGYLILGGFMKIADGTDARLPCLVCGALFFAAEYGMWFSSCFWMGDTLRNPYFWFDGMGTVNMVLLLPSYQKAVTA